MRHTATTTLLAATTAFVACAPTANPGNRDAQPDAAALAGIEALHAADRAGVLAHDPAALLNLWSEDPVALPPDGPNLTGREAIENMLSAMGETPASERMWKTVDYTQSFDEVFVIPGTDGTWGWDLGSARTVLEHREDGRRVAVTAKLLRILRRDGSGAWKVHRSMWTQGQPERLDEEGP